MILNKKAMKEKNLLMVSIWLLSFNLVALSLYGQNKNVSGTVTTLTNLTVANIEVSAHKSGDKVLTNSDGSYTINCLQKDVLSFSGIVFEPKKLKIRNLDMKGDINLTFKNTDANIDLAIQEGYIRDRQELIDAINLFESQKYCKYTNMIDLLKSIFPSVMFQGDDCIVVRGMTSLNLSSCAIFVVDGKIMDGLPQILPCEIKNITLLKDESTSMYGVRGTNGVFVIELNK